MASMLHPSHRSFPTSRNTLLSELASSFQIAPFTSLQQPVGARCGSSQQHTRCLITVELHESLEVPHHAHGKESSQPLCSLKRRPYTQREKRKTKIHPSVHRRDPPRRRGDWPTRHFNRKLVEALRRWQELRLGLVDNT
jgi:hypothetical protein